MTRATHTDDQTEVLPVTGDAGTAPPPPPAELTEALAAAAPRRWWNRTTLVLAGIVLLIGGFLGGVGAQERWGTTPAAPAAGPRLPDGPGTSGTVKLVDGTTLYLETADGATVTVRTSDTTTVKVAQPAALSSLGAGQQVTVQGSADAEGVVTATSVSAG